MLACSSEHHQIHRDTCCCVKLTGASLVLSTMFLICEVELQKHQELNRNQSEPGGCGSLLLHLYLDSLYICMRKATNTSSLFLCMSLMFSEQLRTNKDVLLSEHADCKKENVIKLIKTEVSPPLQEVLRQTDKRENYSVDSYIYINCIKRQSLASFEIKSSFKANKTQ